MRRIRNLQPSHLSIARRRYHNATTAERTRRKAVRRFGAPKSIDTIADGIFTKDKPVIIRPNGSCRRVALLDPHLKPREFEGLAYRLKTLKRNRSLSSVLIISDDPEKYRGVQEEDDFPLEEDRMLGAHYNIPPLPGTSWYTAGGYDAITIQGRDKGPTMQYLTNLALAIRGENDVKAKIPFIFVPNGAITDGGAVFMLSSYVMVTENSSFTILNPGRGLTFDPTGMSWLLPRLGQEFKQRSADCAVGCAIIMALMGYEADYKDMVFTGLATHCLPSPVFIEDMEAILSETPSWEQQAMLKEPVRYQGSSVRTMRPEIYRPDYDHNAQLRNMRVGQIVEDFSCFSADGRDILIKPNTANAYNFADPSLDVESFPALADIEHSESDLVNWAFTFMDIFMEETTVLGILERLKERANPSRTDVEDEVKTMSGKFARHMEKQSPLALACTFRLLWLGANRKEKVDTCIRREQGAQMRLLHANDFKAWQEVQKKSSSASVQRVKWQYDHISQVSNDHVAEIVREGPE